MSDPTGLVLTSALVAQPLSGLDDEGVLWTTTDLGGWGSPASTLQLTPKANDHGAWLSPRFLTPRTVPLGGLLDAPSKSAARDALDRLNAACSLDAATLAVTEEDLTRTVTVYRADEVLHTWQTDTLVQWSVHMQAPDPRKYGPPSSLVTPLPAAAGGITWPITWPAMWTGVTASGSLHVDNPGNIVAPCRLVIDGPCQGPRIRHEQTGRELNFASSYTVPAGSSLTIDTAAKSALESGVRRNQFITSRGWFGVQPGANDFTFSAASYNTTARMHLVWSPAYL